MAARLIFSLPTSVVQAVSHPASAEVSLAEAPGPRVAAAARPLEAAVALASVEAAVAAAAAAAVVAAPAVAVGVAAAVVAAAVAVGVAVAVFAAAVVEAAAAAAAVAAAAAAEEKAVPVVSPAAESDARCSAAVASLVARLVAGRLRADPPRDAPASVVLTSAATSLMVAMLTAVASAMTVVSAAVRPAVQNAAADWEHRQAAVVCAAHRLAVPMVHWWAAPRPHLGPRVAASVPFARARPCQAAVPAAPGRQAERAFASAEAWPVPDLDRPDVAGRDGLAALRQADLAASPERRRQRLAYQQRHAAVR